MADEITIPVRYADCADDLRALLERETGRGVKIRAMRLRGRFWLEAEFECPRGDFTIAQPDFPCPSHPSFPRALQSVGWDFTGRAGPMWEGYERALDVRGDGRRKDRRLAGKLRALLPKIRERRTCAPDALLSAGRRFFRLRPRPSGSSVPAVIPVERAEAGKISTSATCATPRQRRLK